MTNIPDLIARLEGYLFLRVILPQFSNIADDCDEAAQALRDLQAVAEAAGFVVARYTGGCESFMAPTSCVSAGRKRDAEYGADQWCDACVLREALAKLNKHE